MSFAENWQKFLGNINERIPIKKITGALDKHNPLTSFYILLLIILVIIFFAVPFSTWEGTQKTEFKEVTIKLANDKGEILSNFEFTIKNVMSGSEKTYFTDNSGKLTISLDTSSEYYFIIEKKGYYLFEETIDPNNIEFKVILKTFELPASTTRTLSFIDSTNNTTIEEALNVSIRCENGEVITPESIEVTNGSYSFEVPSDCGSLLATAQGNSYSADSMIIPSTESVVRLDPSAFVSDLGTVKVTVKSGDKFIEATVKLFEIEDLLNPIKTAETTWSAAKFTDLPVGDYKIVTSDSSGRYLSGSVEVEILKDDLTKETINMIDSSPENGSNPINPDTNEPIVVRTLVVTLKDQATGLEIEDPLLDPTITLLKDGNETIDIRSLGQGFLFTISDLENYSLRASAEGYIPQVKEVTVNVNNYNFNLEKVTVSNVAKIKADILDEDQIPVVNAKVLIYDSVTGYIDARFALETTDENGEVIFEDIPQGDFFLKVKKIYLEGDSASFVHIPPEDTNIEVPVEIGEGRIELVIKNGFGDQVSDAEVSLYLETGELLGSDFANTVGTYSKKIKADKKVYVVIGKNSYMPYFTEIIEVHKNKIIIKEIVLSQEYSGNVPYVDYLGVYNTNNQIVESLANNEVFYYKFRLTNPVSSDRMGFVFKIGQEDNITNDIIFIKPISNSLGIPMYYSQTPYNNIVPEGTEAKLVDILWNSITPGVYEITIPTRTRNAKINDMVPVFFAAYLSNAPDYENNTEFEQYQYFIDTQELCNNIFCFKGQYVDLAKDLRFDISNNLEIPMLVNSDYLVEYTITNAKSTTYDNVRLTINNTDSTGNPTEIVNIKNYTVNGVFNGSGSSQEGVYHYQMPFDVDEFTVSSVPAFSETSFIETLNPLYLGQSELTHKIISDQEVIYNLGLNLLSNNLHSMIISYEPTNIVPGVGFDMLVTVKDELDQPVELAVINIYQKLSNYTSPIYTGKTTDTEGKVNIQMPTLQTGETIIIEAQKSTYFAEDIEIEITEDVLDVLYNSAIVNPDSPVVINIHKSNYNGTIEKISLQNKTTYDLKLEPFSTEDVSFIYSNLLDLGKTLTFLNSQVSAGGEFIIPAGEERILNIKMVPGADAINLVETEYLEGSIKGHVTRGNTSYVFNIPIETQVSVGEGVYEDNCLVAIGYMDPWVSVINGGGSELINFTIQNNCRSAENPEQPITLKNIRARIVSEGDKFGYYDLMVNSSTTRLSEGIYKTIIQEVEPDRPYSAVLNFNAAGTKFGDVKTKIYLNAQIETENGLVYVNNGAGEELLTAEMKILQISDCFEFHDSTGEINNMLEIESSILKQTGTKELIVKNKCADAGRFKVSFCPNRATDTACQDIKYQNMSGSMNNELEYSFGDSEKTVQIFKPEVPGAYVISVLIQSLDNNDRAIASVYKPLKVNVKDALWMDDPFIEVDEKTNKTAIVKLYNNDINMTPWDYAVVPSSGVEDSIFTKFMSDSDSEIYFEKMNFNSPNALANMDVFGGDGLTTAGAVVGGLGLATIAGGITVAALASSGGVALGLGSALGAVFGGGAIVGSTTVTATTLAGLNPATVTILSAIGPYGWVAIGVIAAVGIMVSSWKNVVNFGPVYHVLDVPPELTTPDGEAIKEFNVMNLSEEDIHLNIFDITGARYFTYLKLVAQTADWDKSGSKIKDRLTKDETLKTEMPKCNGVNHKALHDTYNVINKSENCNNTFDIYEITDDKIKYGVECYGKKPKRNKIQLQFNGYTSCKYDETIWPEQAGIKPIQFELGSLALTELKESSKLNIFKQYNLYPNLTDSDEELDALFIESNKIGQFRFEFHPQTVMQEPNIDLEVYDCSTDSDKIGKTGPGVIPKVNLDWTWDTQELDKCTDNFCDATQLTQTILNRIIKTKELLETQQITCPKSTDELVSETLSGSKQYTAEPDGALNEIPAGKTGISNVNMFIEADSFKIKTYIENRTTVEQTGTLNLGLGSLTPTSVQYYNYINGEYEDVTIASSYSIVIPADEEENVAEYIFTYEFIEDENIPLTVNYSGSYTDPAYTSFDSVVSLGVYSYQAPESCGVPATTMIYNGTDYIDFWFNPEQYQNAQVAWAQSDIDNLKSLLQFDAYLITDNYNTNFKNAFDKAYGGKASVAEGLGVYSLMSSPTVFEDGYLSPLFKNNLNYTLKYSPSDQGVNILTPGKYKVRIDLVFDNEQWNFEEDGDVDAQAIVTFTYISGPEDNSAFYRLPFDGFTGYEDDGYNRQGYGLAYLGDDIIIGTTNDQKVRTDYDKGSNPLKYLNIIKEDNFFKLNSEVETRGNVLKIESQENQIKMTYSPSIATPVLMKVSNNKLNPFIVYYRLTEAASGELVYGGLNLTRWNGFKEEMDFSGDHIYNVFNNAYDQMSHPNEGIANAYKMEWPIVNNKGEITLRSIFYTPDTKNYILKDKSTVDVKFMVPNSNYSKSIDLPGTSTLDISSIQKVFDGIKEKKICVTNSADGSISEFWWNPAELYTEEFT